MTQSSITTALLRCVLIADDQPDFRALLRQMLAGIADETIECDNGADAVGAFERYQPDWALLDWSMPGLDGLAAARIIRARGPEARIIVLSAHASPMLAREAAAAGACGCFPKERLPDVLALLRTPLPAPTSTNPSSTQRPTLS